MATQEFSWQSKCGSQINKKLQRKLKPIKSYYLAQLLRYKYTTCDFVPIEAQGCQLLSKFLDNIDYIIIKNLYPTN